MKSVLALKFCGFLFPYNIFVMATQCTFAFQKLPLPTPHLKTRIKIPPYFKIGSFCPLCPDNLLQAIKRSTVPCSLCQSLSNAHLLIRCIRGWLIVLQGEEGEHLLMDCCTRGFRCTISCKPYNPSTNKRNLISGRLCHSLKVT